MIGTVLCGQYVVLLHHREEWVEWPVVEDPHLEFLAHAREDMEWLLEQLDVAEGGLQDAGGPYLAKG